MELRTQILSATEWEQEVKSIISLLQRQGKNELIVSYGWGCNLDMDELYHEVPLPLSRLQEWVTQSLQLGIFTLGESILHIVSRDKEVSIDLGDEADISLTTNDEEFAMEAINRWNKRGITFYQVTPV